MARRRGRTGIVGALSLALCSVAAPCAGPRSLHAQTLTEPTTPTTPTTPLEVLRMLREAWGLAPPEGLVDDVPYPGVGDTLADGTTDPEVAADALARELDRSAKLLASFPLSDEQQGAIKKAQALAEADVRAAVDRWVASGSAAAAERRAVRAAFSSYLDTVESVILPGSLSALSEVSGPA